MKILVTLTLAIECVMSFNYLTHNYTEGYPNRNYTKGKLDPKLQKVI